MKYLNKTFTLPACTKAMTSAQYDLAVGKITQVEYDLLTGNYALGDSRPDTHPDFEKPNNRYWFERFCAQCKERGYYAAFNAAQDDGGYSPDVDWKALYESAPVPHANTATS